MDTIRRSAHLFFFRLFAPQTLPSGQGTDVVCTPPGAAEQRGEALGRRSGIRRAGHWGRAGCPPAGLLGLEPCSADCDRNFCFSHFFFSTLNFKACWFSRTREQGISIESHYCVDDDEYFFRIILLAIVNTTFLTFFLACSRGTALSFV